MKIMGLANVVLLGERKTQEFCVPGFSRKTEKKRVASAVLAKLLLGAMILTVLCQPLSSWADGPASVLSVNPEDVPGKGTVARSERWKEEGDAIWSNVAANQWAEYSLGTDSGKLFVKVSNHGELPPPLNYAYEIQVFIDGVAKGIMRVAEGMTGEIEVPRQPAALVRLVWLNDAWVEGKYDANLKIERVWTKLPVGAPTDPLEAAKAELRKLGHGDADIGALIIDFLCAGGGATGKPLTCVGVK